MLRRPVTALVAGVVVLAPCLDAVRLQAQVAPAEVQSPATDRTAKVVELRVTARLLRAMTEASPSAATGGQLAPVLARARSSEGAGGADALIRSAAGELEALATRLASPRRGQPESSSWRAELNRELDRILVTLAGAGSRPTPATPIRCPAGYRPLPDGRCAAPPGRGPDQCAEGFYSSWAGCRPPAPDRPPNRCPEGQVPSASGACTCALGEAAEAAKHDVAMNAIRNMKA